MGRAPRPGMLIKIISQHWKSVVLCLALTAFFMVEAAPARAGAMKKGGRWAHPGTFSRLMRSWHRGGSKGGSRGSGKSNHPKGGGEDNGIGGHGVKTDKPPCVGICHYNRLFGIVTPAPKPRWWKGNLMIMGKLWHLSCPERFDLILYLSQGSVRGSVLPEQAEPLPGPAWGPLEKGPRLGRLIPIGGSGEWSTQVHTIQQLEEQAWVSQALNTHWYINHIYLSWAPWYLSIWRRLYSTEVLISLLIVEICFAFISSDRSSLISTYPTLGP